MRCFLNRSKRGDWNELQIAWLALAGFFDLLCFSWAGAMDWIGRARVMDFRRLR
jgi:hypothetical protein